MVAFKFEYNDVEIKLGHTFLNMYGDLYSSCHFKNTHIVASSYGKHGNINCVWLIFFGTLIILPFILYWS
jgi:hypothetical protein